MLGCVALCVAAPGTAGGRHADVPGRCCFTVAVDAGGTFTDTYMGTGVGTWSGSSEASWQWATRFIVAYTGRGLKIEPHPEGSAAAASSSKYTLIFSNPLFNQLVTCPTGAPPAPVLNAPPVAPVSAAGLAAARRDIGDYARALVLGAPPGIRYACPPLGGNDLEVLRAIDASSVVVQAPSVDNFLGGRSFGRSCWRNVDVTFPNPFTHRFTGTVVVGVHFTWFPRAQLKAKERALASMNGRRVSSTRDYSRAQDAVFAAQNGTKKPAGCE